MKKFYLFVVIIGCLYSITVYCQFAWKKAAGGTTSAEQAVSTMAVKEYALENAAPNRERGKRHKVAAPRSAEKAVMIAPAAQTTKAVSNERVVSTPQTKVTAPAFTIKPASKTVPVVSVKIVPQKIVKIKTSIVPHRLNKKDQALVIPENPSISAISNCPDGCCHYTSDASQDSIAAESVSEVGALLSLVVFL